MYLSSQNGKQLLKVLLLFDSLPIAIHSQIVLGLHIQSQMMLHNHLYITYKTLQSMPLSRPLYDTNICGI